MVNGADDPVVRLSFINGLDYANLWEGRCHTLARAGHAPFRDAPETFNQLFHRFLMDLTVTRARPGEVESTPVRAAREA
jgi:pimeloyl-ACP methyl ester carboxylesterase